MKKLITISLVLALCLSLVTVAMAAGDNYFVAGSEALTGYNWDNSKNQMTADGSIYTITFADVPAGKHEFKVVKNSNWSTCWPTSNYIVNTSKVCDVTVNFDPADNSIAILIDGVPTGDFYIVAGDSGLCNGINWGEANQDNRMTLSGGIYTITFKDVMPGAYGFKVVKNGDWNQAWPPSNYNIDVTAVSDVTITFDPSTNTANATITPTGQQVEIVNKFVVAGDEGLTGESWNPSSEANEMTEDGEVYKITFEDVTAGTYGFKIVKNGSWASSWPGENYSITLEDTADVTITFNPNDSSIDVATVSGGVAVPDTYVVAGVAGLCGSEWNATDENNKMTENDGVYSITYTDVAIGEYELKVVKNGDTWIGGVDGNNVFFTVNAVCDVTITYSEADGVQITGAYINGVEPPAQTGDVDMTVIIIAALVSCTALCGVVLTKKKYSI